METLQRFALQNDSKKQSKNAITDYVMTIMIQKNVIKKKFFVPRRLIAGLAATSLLLSGCAMHQKVPNLGESRYYPQCVNPFVEMQRKDNEVAVNTAKSAAVGGLAGAVIGFIAGDWKGALIGLGIGALGAGVLAYTFTKLDQVADENTRFASIRVTANQDLHKATRLQLYSYESMTCYAGEFDRLQDAYESGTMSKDEYTNRFKEIHRAMVGLGEVIGNMEADIERTEREFNTSFAKVPSKAQEVQPASESLDEEETPDEEASPAPSVAPATRNTSVAKKGSTKAKVIPQAAHKKASAKKQTVVQPAPAHATRKKGKRIGQQISNAVAKNKSQVKRTQAKNDDDLSKILDDFAGKVKPPPQNKQTIKKEYGETYAQTRKQVKDLRAVHREALDIMHSAAREAGIDKI